MAKNKLPPNPPKLKRQDAQYIDENDIEFEDCEDEQQPSEESAEDIDEPVEEQPVKQKRQYKIKDPKTIEKKKIGIQKAREAKAAKVKERKTQKLMEELVSANKKPVKETSNIDAIIEKAVEKRISQLQPNTPKVAPKPKIPKATTQINNIDPEIELLKKIGLA